MQNDVRLTEKQRRCAASPDMSTAILAGAGSGKTMVLIERIKNAVLLQRASFSGILAITFTEKAAGELVYRLAKEMPERYKANIGLATVGTIDGFCAKILREDAPSVGIAPDFDILDEHGSQILVHRAVSATLREMLGADDERAKALVDELDFGHAIGCLEELYSERWSVKGLPDGLAGCLEKASQKIAKEKKALGALDFLDLEIEALELLRNHSGIRKKYQSRFSHIFVDEFQDTSGLQAEIIRSIYVPGKNALCIVGDPGQSIYRFRGANPAGVEAMKGIIGAGGGAVAGLDENFRSGPEIIGFVNEVFQGRAPQQEGGAQPFLPLSPMAAHGAKVLKIAFDAEGLTAEEARIGEADEIGRFIAGETGAGNAACGDFAILLRSFTDASVYENALARRGLPFYRSGGRTFLDRKEIGDIILCLRALDDPASDTYAYGLARSTIIGLSEDECYGMFAGRGGGFFEILAADRRFEFLAELASLKGCLSISELIREIVRRAGLHRVFERIYSSGQPSANIEKLIEMAGLLEKGQNFSIREFLGYVDDLKLRGIGIAEPPVFGRRDDAVKVMTIHAAKGLEFKCVVIADMFRGKRNRALPYIFHRDMGVGLKKREPGNPIGDPEKTPEFTRILEAEQKEDRLESERLLYVAATRAMEKLVLCIPKGKSSAWLDMVMPAAERIRPAEIRGSAEPRRRPESGAAPLSPLAAIPLRRSISFTVSELETFERSPAEYFNKYVFGYSGGMPAARGAAMSESTVGSIVHKAICLCARHPDAGLDAVISHACCEYGYLNPLPDDVSRIRGFMANYLSSPYHDSRLVSPRHEVPFVLKLNEAAVRGTIDCVYKDGGGYSIIDYKTDRAKGAARALPKAEEYRLQMTCYAIAAEKALAARVNKAVLLFLDDGRAEVKEMSELDMKNGLDEMQMIIRRMLSQPFPDPPCT